MGPSYLLIGLLGPESCDCGLKEGLEGLLKSKSDKDRQTDCRTET